MWVMKLKTDPKKQFLGNLITKYNLSAAGYSLSYYKDKRDLYIIVSGLIYGEEKDKKRFVRAAKKEKEIVSFELNDNFAIAVIRQPLYAEPLYNPKVIHQFPMTITKESQIWTMASFNRKDLEEVLHFAEKYVRGKIIKFRQEKITNVSFTKVFPELTKNQKKALEIAIKHGYYDYPKKIKMEKLAKEMGISYSTYQAHLKKAEGKLLPEIYKEL